VTLQGSRLIVLGGGAVVEHCFLPALDALGLTGRTMVVDSRPVSDALKRRYPDVDFRRQDYRNTDLSGGRAVFVALPNRLHEDAVNLTLDRGLDVLCEKPLTLSSASCRRLAERARAAGHVLAVNMIRRQYPSVQIARRVIDAGLIGDIRSIAIEHGSAEGWPVQTLASFCNENGGVLADMGVHYLDLAEFFLGSLAPKAYRDDWRGGVEADAAFELESTTGAQVRIALSRLRPLCNRVCITGTRGRIEFGVDEFDQCHVTLGDGHTIEVKDERPCTTFESCFARQFDDLLGGSGSFVDGDSAARTVELIEWAYAKRKPVMPASRCERASVLVTGATGFIGSHLVEGLANRGFNRITAAVRTPHHCAYIGRLPIDLQSVDLLDPEQVRAAVRGQRYVFHLAYGRDGDQRRQTTVDGTRLVVEAAIAEGCEAVVALSTMYVFGQPGGVVDETFPYRPIGGEYGRSKAEMERRCLDRARTSARTRIVILNPSCVYGPRGKTYSELPVNLVRSESFCWIENGRGLANYTYVTNLVDAMVRAAEVPAAHGERFIINDGAVTWRDFLDPLVAPWADSIPSYTRDELIRLEKADQRRAFADAVRSLSRSPHLRDAARATSAGRFAASVVRRYAPSLAAQSPSRRIASNAPPEDPTPAVWLADLFSPATTRFSSEKARRVLGWTPAVDLAEGQHRTMVSLGIPSC
jgi:nucleoside-diphosphate-sugar epimerase/predicted dehydrogenase